MHAWQCIDTFSPSQEHVRANLKLGTGETVAATWETRSQRFASGRECDLTAWWLDRGGYVSQLKPTHWEPA